MRMQQRQGDLYPALDESYIDFMSRCGNEIGDQDVCQLIWEDAWDEDRSAKNGDIRHKTHAGKTGGLEYVLSDETPDRMGDVIMADGWDLANFQKNPIALFGHNSSFPIGKWKNLRVVDKQLRGRLELAAAGTSPRIDEIRALVDADILRAVSVGFAPKESRPRPESDFGVFFTKAELMETSLVAVPANPNALAVAKSLNISPATIDLVFAGKGNGHQRRRRGLTGGQADTPPQVIRKGATMSSFAQRITATEQRLNALRDQLNEHWTKTDETNVSDEQLSTANGITERINQEERALAGLRDAERHLATTSDDGAGSRALVPARAAQSSIVAAPAVLTPRPFSLAPKKQLSALDHLVRAGTVMLKAHCDRAPFQQKLVEIYGQDEGTRAVLEWTQRAASTIATTTQTGWAAERCSPPSWRCCIRRRSIRGWRPRACR
jgi:HK97 family phage prohead protease